MKKYWHIIFLGILTLLFLLPNSTWAACPSGKTVPDACEDTADLKAPGAETPPAAGGGGGLGPILPECAKNGRCGLCDLVQVAVNFGEFLFAISGALLLLFFAYGGFLMLVSGGNPTTVGKGKSVLVNSVIGILIVFTAYMGVNFIITSVTKGSFNWSGNLECKELPKEVGWVAGLTGQGAGGAETGGVAGGVPTPQTCEQQVNIHADCVDNNGCGDCGYCGLPEKKCKPKKNDKDFCQASEIVGGSANGLCKSNLCTSGACTAQAGGSTPPPSGNQEICKTQKNPGGYGFNIGGFLCNKGQVVTCTSQKTCADTGTYAYCDKAGLCEWTWLKSQNSLCAPGMVYLNDKSNYVCRNPLTSSYRCACAGLAGISYDADDDGCTPKSGTCQLSGH